MSRAEIQELVHRYAHATVTRNPEQWAGTWDPDALWQIGDTFVEGRVDILEHWLTRMASYRSIVQTVVNGTAFVSTEGGSGSGHWYVNEYCECVDGERFHRVARFDDTYFMRDEMWRFAERTFTPLYESPLHPDAAFFIGAPAFG